LDGGGDGYRTAVSDQPYEHDEVDSEELEQQDGEPLPDREMMSPIAFDPGPFPLDPTLPLAPDA
jgi:hypothetical protein